MKFSNILKREKSIKKILIITCLFILLTSLTGCNAKKEEQNNQSEEIINITKDNKSVVLYFSATGTTENIAKKISELTNSDIIEIVPKVAYTTEDLKYSNDNCRVTKEQNDKKARPEIKNEINVNQYDTIYLGYPIWWGTNPRIILTLLDNTNLENKNIVLFCTSGSSGIETSISDLRKYNSKLNILAGKRFGSNASSDDIKNWLDTIDIPRKEEVSKMYIKVNGKTLKVNIEDNSSSKSLVEKLQSGDITINMSDYGNFEKVGDLGFSLPTNDKEITTTPGDIILYQGNKITIYYDTNKWNFTKLGKIENITQKELKNILGKDDVTVTLTLKEN